MDAVGLGRHALPGPVIAALGYTIWNYVLERVEAPRAAIFLSLQPLPGALLGIWLLHEPLTLYTAAGGVPILTGLHLTVKAGRVG
jgi:drug/metabolite transporter (DMT)-like permease